MQQDIRKTIYEFLIQYIDANGYPPSIREKAVGCFVSPMTVSSTLGILEAQGKITRTAGKARSIRIVRRD